MCIIGYVMNRAFEDCLDFLRPPNKVFLSSPSNIKNFSSTVKVLRLMKPEKEAIERKAPAPFCA